MRPPRAEQEGGGQRRRRKVNLEEEAGEATRAGIVLFYE